MRVVNTLDELLELPADKHINGYRRRAPIKLDIAHLDGRTLTAAQDAINSLQERGGSLAGAAFMFLTLLYGVTQVFRRVDTLMSWEAVLGLGAVLVVAFGVGVVAKYAALVVTRWQFGRCCREQHRRLSAVTSSSGHPAAA